MRNFPIISTGLPCEVLEVPMFYAEQFNTQAKKNHGQSIKELAMRGGLSPKELYCVAHNISFRESREPEAFYIKWLTDANGQAKKIEYLNKRIKELLGQLEEKKQHEVYKIVNSIKNMKATVKISDEDFPIISDSEKIVSCIGKTYEIDTIIYSADGKRYFLKDCPLPQWHERYLEVK